MFLGIVKAEVCVLMIGRLDTERFPLVQLFEKKLGPAQNWNDLLKLYPNYEVVKNGHEVINSQEFNEIYVDLVLYFSQKFDKKFLYQKLTLKNSQKFVVGMKLKT